jgi:predicted nucleic acid-binding protein
MSGVLYPRTRLMPLSEALLDTSTLSAIMKGSSRVLDRARAYLNEHRVFKFSIITRYEILRGLKAKDASKRSRRLIASVAQVRSCR